MHKILGSSQGWQQGPELGWDLQVTLWVALSLVTHCLAVQLITDQSCTSTF